MTPQPETVQFHLYCIQFNLPITTPTTAQSPFISPLQAFLGTKSTSIFYASLNVSVMSWYIMHHKMCCRRFQISNTAHCKVAHCKVSAIPMYHATQHHLCVSSDFGFQTGALDLGRGGLPRIMSADFSATMMVGPFRLPLTTLGMMDASTTRSPSKPITLVWGSTTAIGSSWDPILHVHEGW